MKFKTIFALLVITFILIISGCSTKKNHLTGKWVASTENQKTYQMDDGSIKGGNEEYILECYDDGSYDLKEGENDLANARFKISNDKVTFYDEGSQILAICKILDNNKILDCSEKSYYAIKYTRIIEK